MGKNMKHIPYFQGEAVLLCKDYKENYLLDTHSKLFGKFQDDLFSKEKVFSYHNSCENYCYIYFYLIKVTIKSYLILLHCLMMLKREGKNFWQTQL